MDRQLDLALRFNAMVRVRARIRVRVRVRLGLAPRLRLILILFSSHSLLACDFRILLALSSTIHEPGISLQLNKMFHNVL